MGDDPDGESLVQKCLKRFKKLRALVLENTCYEVVPKNIGTLKHLRFLSLMRNSKMKKLPNSICKLQCLQTLAFASSGIERLPTDMRYMIGLRMLSLSTKQKDLSETGLEHLTSLRHLVIHNCENLEYLFEGIEKLTCLYRLSIGGCKNLISLPHGLKSSRELKILVVDRCEKLNLNVTLGKGNEDKLVGSGLSLQTLILQQLPMLEALPQWLLVGSASTLQVLRLVGCENLTTSPREMNFTSLKLLRILNCPKLSSLQLQMPCLETFATEGCPILSDRLNPVSGEDWANIAHVSRIQIDGNVILV